jgi:cytochrome o ubiquinol oxidase subunit 2
MKKAFKIGLIVIFLLGIIAISADYISHHNIPVLNPKGAIGIQQRELIVISSLLMCIVVIPVFIIMFIFSWKYREGKNQSKYLPNWDHSILAECIWWGVPFIIIVILAVITWRSTHELNPFKPIENGKEPITIQVVALDWKWLFIYPELGIATVNYIQFPEKTPLNFEISSDAPMNSFWIPQLGGQIYAMPGMRTKLHLIANEIGDFRGSSSNISGKGFAGMVFRAVSSDEEAFDEWVEEVRASPYILSEEEYRYLAMPSEYDPVIYYSEVKEGLFEEIVMKFMPMPEK